MFLEQSQARFDLLKGDIQSIQKGTSSISEYLNRLKHIADSLAALQHPVLDKELVGHALNGLGPEYTNFVVMMENREHPPTFSELRSRLFSHEQRLTRTSHHGPPMGDTALLSTYGSKTQHYPPYVQPTGHTNGSHNHGFPSQHNRLNQARQQQGNNRFPQSQFQSQSRGLNSSTSTSPSTSLQPSQSMTYPDHSSITNEFGPIRSTSSLNSSNGTPILDPPITSPPSSPTPFPPPTTAVISEPPPPPLVPVHPMQLTIAAVNHCSS
ncbi:NB-ARC domain-containing protein [Fagus crenata]